MHIHALPASAAGDALAGAQAAETAMAVRRARELQEAASKLKAASFEISLDPGADAETVAMVGAWSGTGSGGAQSGAASQASGEVPGVERTPPQGPVSYWA
jgi:hypothetical protein